MSSKYLMVCDERGVSRWPSNSKTWAFGGYIVNTTQQKEVDTIWKEIKNQLCGNSSCELKWCHFFPGHHQNFTVNPLISKNPKELREQASWAVDKIFDIPDILPVNLYIRKDEASDALFEKNEESNVKKYKILNINTIFFSIFGQFALFLKSHDANGEIWFDRLGSKKEEKRRQDMWLQVRDGEWKVRPENQQIMKRISSKLNFLDSKNNSLIQAADFISGVIWAASEGDERFLIEAFSKYLPSGPRTSTLIRFS